MSLLFTDPQWREQNQKLLQNLSKRATILETSVQQNPLPSAEEALVVFNTWEHLMSRTLSCCVDMCKIYTKHSSPKVWKTNM
ncbi:hypothetical protein AtubIFM57143_004972 [Aspergillus tubingensis]|nr:hypothetical protein AtubIFM57143_004972 [Aspergillus tubingensis]